MYAYKADNRLCLIIEPKSDEADKSILEVSILTVADYHDNNKKKLTVCL